MPKSNEKLPAQEAALRYLEYRARTVKEVEEQLRMKEYTDEEIASCIERLEQLHYLDDEEYALSYLRHGLSKRRARRRILRELAERGVDKDTFEQAIYRYEDEECCDLAEVERQNALAEAGRILPQGYANDKEKAKLARRLMSLGYETAQIYSVLGELGGNRGDA